MKISKKIVIIGGGILVFAAAGAFAMGNQGLPVETAKVGRTAVQDWYTEEGVLSLGDTSQIISQVSGAVKEIPVHENDRVEKDDILVVIDSKDYEYAASLAQDTLDGLMAKLDQIRIGQVMTVSPQEYLFSAKKEAEASEAALQSKKTVYEASKVLYETGDISRAEYEQNEAAYQQAELSREQAKSRYEESRSLLDSLKGEGIDEQTVNKRFYDSVLRELEAQVSAQKTQVDQWKDKLEKCTIRAEADGIVTSLPVKGASMIQAGETAAVMKGQNEAFVEADVLTSAIPYIHDGTPVKAVFRIRGTEKTYEGNVRDVYEFAKKGTSALGLSEYRVHVKAKLAENEELKGMEGYGVNVRFLLYDNKNALTVPADAVFEVDGKAFVFTVEDGKAKTVPVTLEYKTGTTAVISSGVGEGDAVIARADEEGLYDGVKVKVSKN